MELNVQKPARKYEAVVILHPDLAEEAQKNFFKKQKEILKKFEGEFNHLDTWGKRRLANPINKLKVGTYFHSTFEASAKAIAELERTMRIDENVLRFKHMRLDDRISLPKHLEGYRDVIKASVEREQERAKKRSAATKR